MFLANLSKRERILFYLTIATISLSLMYNFMLKPLAVSFSRLNQQIFNKEVELKRNIKYLKKKDKVEGVYLKYAEAVKRRGSDEEEMASLLKAVEELARASQIHIANIKPKPVKDLVFCKKYILEMNCEATMEKYIAFIYNLQKSAQSIRVERLKLISPGKGSPLLKAGALITKVLTEE